MKPPLKYLSTIGVVVALLTWLSVSVRSTEEEQEVEENMGARDAFRRAQLQDENGQIPPDGLIDAYKQKQDMEFLPEAWAEFSQSGQPEVVLGSEPGDLASIEPGVLEGKGPDPDVPSPDPWVSIGPNNISGRIRSITFTQRPLRRLYGSAQYLAVSGNRSMMASLGVLPLISWLT